MFKSVFRTGIRATYNVSENPSFVSEPWSVYPAKHRTSGKNVSVFIFDKTKFESQIHRLCQMASNSKNPKVVIAESYQLIKYEVTQMSKLKHPQVLTIFEVLEETKSKFLFVSESVSSNLATINIKKNLDNLSIQKGLLQLSRGLQFLHNFCSIIHCNIQPSSIFITTQGDWKLSGFDFLQNLNEMSPSERDNFYIMSNSSIVPFANMNLNYTAPELLVDGQSRLDFANDMWSLGCLIFFLYNNGESLINCFDSSNIADYKAEFKKFENKFYNHRPSELKYLLKEIPSNLYPLFMQIMARYPHDRITIDQFVDSEFFNGSLIKAMLFIDEFSTKTLDEKLIFIKGIVEAESTEESLLYQLPAHFKTSKFIPLLIDLIINELNVIHDKSIESNIDELLCYSLSVTFIIGSQLSSLSFQDKIYVPLLKDDSKSKKGLHTSEKLINLSVGMRLTLVEYFSVLDSKLNESQFVDLIKRIIGLVLGTSETNQKEKHVHLQELFLKKLSSVIHMFDFPYIKGTLIPLLCHFFQTTTTLSTKLLAIEVFEMLVDKKIIDKLIVNEQVFPIFKSLKSRDKRIVKQVLQFFDKLSHSEHISLPLDTLVESVIPQCFNLIFGCNDCNQKEFKGFMATCSKIQDNLVQKKIATLLDKSDLAMSPTNGNFESLINTQKINVGNRDEVLRAPQSKDIMQPTRKTTPTLQPGPKVSSQPTHANTLNSSSAVNSRSPAKMAKKVQPLNLKQNVPSKRSPNIHTPNNDRLLNSLHASMNKATISSAQDEDNEFEDFQEAQLPSTEGLNWNNNGTTATNNFTSPSMGALQPKNNPVVPASSNPTSSKYPPGYDFNVVLTPSHAGSQNKQAPQTNSDPWDLL